MIPQIDLSILKASEADVACQDQSDSHPFSTARGSRQIADHGTETGRDEH